MNAKALIMFGAVGVLVFFLYPLLSSGRAGAVFMGSGNTKQPGGTTSSESSKSENKLKKYANALGALIGAIQQSKDRPPAQIDYTTNPRTGAPYDWT